MKGYILIDLEITDPEGFQEYLKLAGPTVKQYGGKVLIGGATSETLEGDWHSHLQKSGFADSRTQKLEEERNPEGPGETTPLLALRTPARSIPSHLIWRFH